MSLTSKESGSSIEPIPQGTHKAVCSGIYDIGKQYSEKYRKWDPSVIVCWQIPALRYEGEDEEDLPRMLMVTYTNSLSEKANLRRILEGWRGKAFTPAQLEGFDLSKVIGVSCMIQIIHKQGSKNIFANIGSIMPLMAGDEPLKVEGDQVLFDMDTTGPGGAIPECVPEWIQKRIQDSKEYKEAVETHVQQPADEDGGNASGDDDLEDTPF